MGQAWDDGTARARVLLVGLVVAALASLLPSLLATGVESPAAVSLAVLTLTLAAIARLGNGLGALAARAVVAAHPSGRAAPPVPAGRVTDPTHHPIRPRAPGSA